MSVLSSIAVGGPRLGAPNAGWDVAPLALAVTLVVLLWWIGIPLRGPVLLSAFLGGLLLDLGVDALGLSLATAIAVMVLTFTIVALRRIRAP